MFANIYKFKAPERCRKMEIILLISIYVNAIVLYYSRITRKSKYTSVYFLVEYANFQINTEYSRHTETRLVHMEHLHQHDNTRTLY